MLNNQTSCNISERDELLQRDRWAAEDIGLKPNIVHGSYYIDFANITIPWLKLATKKFVRLQSATRSLASCKGYTQAITRFNDYLCTLRIDLPLTVVTRSLIIGFLEYLQKKFSIATRMTTLVHLRTFHIIVVHENWLPWPTKTLIFNYDLPKPSNIFPRYIPDNVLAQLKKSLHHLKPYQQRFLTILMETGRRISEVCTLDFDCLEQDEQKDWYLKVEEKKFKKIRLIPISKECFNAIQEQQQFILKENRKPFYLFARKVGASTPHVTARGINKILNDLADKTNIVDANGKKWHFHAHQFRHTLGTSMINNGVSQIMVQHYLGHQSPEMTARYAYVHNDTLKKAFKQYQGNLIDIHGKNKSNEILNAKWLKKNIMSQALPNGICTLPLSQKACPHANACLTCANFSTSKPFLPQHKAQLEQTQKVIENAKNNGWQRIVEMNTTVAKNLNAIILTLEEQNHEQQN